MTFNAYHQVGHNPSWNISSYLEDSCGQGLILSPVNQDPASVERLPVSIRTNCMFDPQFYLPSSQKSKLKAYSFFPESFVNGFSTNEFEVVAKEAADECVAFQAAQDFRNIVIPCRFLNQMYSDYIERHERFSVIPFLEAIDDLAAIVGEIDKPICLSLTLTDHMIQDEGFRDQILNWVTKYPEIDEIYLIYSVERESKQIKSSDFLKAAFSFSKEIRETGLGLIIGYQNTESLLFSFLDDITVTFGTFENTRIFSIDKFLVSIEERRGPRPRIYVPGLLNWILFDDAKQIQRIAPHIWNEIHFPTEYSERVLARTVAPYFNQPELYRHQLICMQEQFNQLGEIPPSVRLDLLGEWIRRAATYYDEIADTGIIIERHGDGSHLSPWNVATKYAKESLL